MYRADKWSCLAGLTSARHLQGYPRSTNSATTMLGNPGGSRVTPAAASMRGDSAAWHLWLASLLRDNAWEFVLLSLSPSDYLAH